MAERFDATFTVDKSVPVVAVPEGKQGYAQMSIRVANAPTSVKVDTLVDAIRNEVPLYTASLAATPKVTLPARTPNQLIEVRLSGPGNGYTWPFNGKLYDPDEGRHRRQTRPAGTDSDDQRIHHVHPIHLHGHTFLVVGDNGPLARKDTVLVPPKQNRAGRLRHRQPRQVDCSLPQHILLRRRYGRLDLSRRLDVNRPVCY